MIIFLLQIINFLGIFAVKEKKKTPLLEGYLKLTDKFAEIDGIIVLMTQ